MNIKGLARGDEAYVSVRINKRFEFDVIISAVSNTEVSVEVHGDTEANVLAGHEALQAATNAVAFILEKPRLKAILKERIAELREEIEDEAEGDPPTPSADDIPF